MVMPQLTFTFQKLCPQPMETTAKNNVKVTVALSKLPSDLSCTSMVIFPDAERPSASNQK